jgi:N-methylhydantoinase A
VRRLAIDVGGTFTDVVSVDGDGRLQIAKTVSTPAEPARAVIEGVRMVGSPGTITAFVHGTTLAINALLQGQLAPTGLITTAGFRDVLEIMRTNRPDMYNLQQDKPEPLVPRRRRLEVSERLDFRGAVIVPLDEEEVRAAARRLQSEGARSVAVCFLFAYLNPAHERRAREIVEAETGLPVTVSSDLVREWREFERTSTTVINAACRPAMEAYLLALSERLSAEGLRAPIQVMQSSGGLAAVEQAATQPVRTLFSGPVGGVAAAAALGRRLGISDVLTLDVGGTSADLALIRDGEVLQVAQRHVERWPVLAGGADIVSIGAGGGSVAFVDRAGGLQVGPRSAGGTPGPACYGLGGTLATLTDAHVVAGNLDPDYFLGGVMRLDAGAAERAIGELAESLRLPLRRVAAGVIEIAEATMLAALRAATVERGYDPRRFALMVFGGAAGLHAAELARRLKIATVVIPPNPAVVSAWGLLHAAPRYDLVRTVLAGLRSGRAEDLDEVLREMEAEAVRRLGEASLTGSPPSVQRWADVRYGGQDFTLQVSLPSRLGGDAELEAVAVEFTQEHRRRFGYSLDDEVVLVNLRVSAMAEAREPVPSPPPGGGKALKGWREVFDRDAGRMSRRPVYERGLLACDRDIEGPAVVEEPQSTHLVPGGARFGVDRTGNLVLALGDAR